jgi:hypothetical protein
MIRKTLHSFFLAVPLLLGGSATDAATLTINVMDEQNRGVRSRVLYKISTPPSVLGDTDNQGKLVRSHDCGTGQVLSARPFHIGSYFESTEEPCKPQLTLRVLSRQTPKGSAVEFRIENIKFADGSPGVITYKAVVATRASDTATAVASCAVNVDTVVEQQAFKIDDASWKAVARKDVDPTEILLGTGWAAPKSVLLPFPCKASGPRIQILGGDAATELSRHFSNSLISVPNSLRTLGLQ